MTKINSKLMIDYDDDNSYLDFISEKKVKYYIKSNVGYKNYIITFIQKNLIKSVSIQQKLNNDVVKLWEYSQEVAESLGIDKDFIVDCTAKLSHISKYWLAINIIEKEIEEYIETEFASSRISRKEYERKLNQYEDDDIAHTIENIQDMIENEYGENATLAEIRQDSEYYYNLLIASTYLRTKHNL
jgi:hypothetical protein